MNCLQYNPEKVYSRQTEYSPGLFEKLSSSMRCMPDFFIGGVQKGGTTSLYHALVQHPQIIPAKNKEIFYYGTTSNYNKGLSFYKPHFATKFYKYLHQLRLGKSAFCIEASTNTIDSTEAPKRILNDNPQAKIIFVLRNPVDRAFSHYKMAVRRGWELAGFEEALELEKQRISEGLVHPLSDPNHNYAYQRLGYTSRGIYVNHLKRWLKEFPAEQILILSSEEFFEDPQKAFVEMCEFLKLDIHLDIDFQKLNEGGADKIIDKTRDQLSQFFKPYNDELFALLNRRFNW